MRLFARLGDAAASTQYNEHGGAGPIEFRRLFDRADLTTNIDFIDVTVIPPDSTIGKHYHPDSEEMYVIQSGSPKVTVDGESQRLTPGDVAVVHPGQWHELINDSAELVRICVVQVRR